MSVLSWNQIHANAAQFADDWKDAYYEKGDTQTFYNEFFEVFGHRRRNLALYEKKVDMVGRSHGFIDLFWPGMLIVEQKSAGRDLDSASTQADDYILALKERERPRYRLVSDFQNFVFTDLETRQAYSFSLEEFPENIKLFDFIAGRRQQIYKDQDPVNIDASDKMSNLHKVLEDAGYEGADLERLLVRIMFCMFADDTGIFEQDTMLNYVRDRTAEDGSDLGGKLIELFQVLDTPNDKRQKTLDEDLSAFQYVNGSLFSDLIRTPSFNSEMRDVLLDCCYFNWSKVSPALFGSLFQTVMLPIEQRQDGAHYTSERNILKTIQPLFIDELREEFDRIKHMGGTHRKKKLEEFHEHLGTLTFFDPACGCGNFLILAYRELRLLELDILDELYPKHNDGTRPGLLDVSHLSKIDVDQFFGIEINEFPVRVAETAMWLVDHQMNMKLGDMFGKAYARLPLQKSAKIYHGNALTTDWNEVIQAKDCSYIIGNPPFIGSKNMTKEQRNELLDVFKGQRRAGILDYVSAWYCKAAYFTQNTNVKCAFVSTNSITQGEQVGVLWPTLLQDFGLKINFAHRTFKWTIDEKKAQGMKIAAVYVVIIGFSISEEKIKHLYEYETPTEDPQKIKVSNINPYLVDRPNLFVTSSRKSLGDVPEIGIGNKPIDGGYYLFKNDEKDTFVSEEPASKSYFRRWIGGDEFLNGYERWCLWMGNVDPGTLKKMDKCLERINNVKLYRMGKIPAKNKPDTEKNKKRNEQTQKLASTPRNFHVENIPESSYLVIPKVSSERRQYIPIGFLDESALASDLLFVVRTDDKFHLGVLSSKMHMDWMRYTCGRLEGRYRYSKDIVYNNFPWPDASDKDKKNIAAKAQDVLDARKQFSESTLSEMYDPDVMPTVLLKAHQALDKAVDAAYRKAVFNDEKDRVEFLFERYQALIEPLTAQASKSKRKKKKS